MLNGTLFFFEVIFMNNSFTNWLVDHIATNQYILIVGCLCIVGFVAVILLANSKAPKSILNIAGVVFMAGLTFLILTTEPYVKNKYIGKADPNCQVYEQDADGNIIYAQHPVLNPDGTPKLGDDGKPMTTFEPVLKQYYFPNQEIGLVNGVLNIRLQFNHDNQLREHYCSFDIFPRVEDKSSQQQTAKQAEMKRWYKKLQSSKDMLDKANAIEQLSQLTPEEIDKIAKGYSQDESSTQKTKQAEKNLQKFKESLQKEVQKREAEKQSQQQGQQGQAKNKGMKPGKGLNITLPAPTKDRNDQGEGEGNSEESQSGDNENQPWESSDGAPVGEADKQRLPPKDR